MSVLALLGGVSGSGKTTFALVLQKRGFRRLSIDEVVWARGGDWPALAASVEDELRVELIALLRSGRDVVLDYPLCQRARRDHYRDLAGSLGADAVLYWFEVAPQELHRRVAARAAGPGPNAFPVAPEQLDRYLAHAQRPTPDEHPIVNPGGE